MKQHPITPELRERIKNVGSQRALARAAGVGQQLLNKIASGKVHASSFVPDIERALEAIPKRSAPRGVQSDYDQGFADGLRAGYLLGRKRPKLN